MSLWIIFSNTLKYFSDQSHFYKKNYIDKIAKQFSSVITQANNLFCQKQSCTHDPQCICIIIKQTKNKYNFEIHLEKINSLLDLMLK